MFAITPISSYRIGETAGSAAYSTRSKTIGETAGSAAYSLGNRLNETAGSVAFRGSEKFASQKLLELLGDSVKGNVFIERLKANEASFWNEMKQLVENFINKVSK